MQRESLRHDTPLSLAGAEFQPPMPAALMSVKPEPGNNGHAGKNAPARAAESNSFAQNFLPSAEVFVAPAAQTAGK